MAVGRLQLTSTLWTKAAVAAISEWPKDGVVRYADSRGQMDETNSVWLPSLATSRASVTLATAVNSGGELLSQRRAGIESQGDPVIGDASVIVDRSGSLLVDAAAINKRPAGK